MQTRIHGDEIHFYGIERAAAWQAHLRYNPGEKTWVAKITPRYAELLARFFRPQDLGEAKPVVDRMLVLQAQAEDDLRHLRETREDREEVDSLFDLLPGLDHVSLYHHQKQAILHGVLFPRWCYWMQMGTGKTLAALATFRTLLDQGEVSRCLVIAPSRLLHEAWERQARQFLGLSVDVIEKTSLQKRVFLVRDSAAQVVVVAYEAIRKLGPQYAAILRAASWLVVFDEAARYVGGKSQQADAAGQISDAARRVLLLTGTPFTGDVERFYRQITILDRGETFGPSWGRFIQLALDWGATQDYWGKVCWEKSPPFLSYLREGVRRNSVQWERNECLDLPERVIRDVPVTLGAEAAKVYHAVRSGGSVPGFGIVLPTGAVKALRLAQVTSGYVYQDDPDGVYRGKYRRLADNAKLDTLLELLSDELEGEKIIVWVRWLEELDIVAEGLKRSRVGFVELSGRTSKQVSEVLSTWRAPAGPAVLLATVQTGGEGLTLNEATAMVFFSLVYDWEVYQQALDRNYRIGQRKRVVVLRLIAQKTVDGNVAKILSKKGRLADLVLGDGEDDA